MKNQQFLCGSTRRFHEYLNLSCRLKLTQILDTLGPVHELIPIQMLMLMLIIMSEVLEYALLGHKSRVICIPLAEGDLISSLHEQQY